MLRHLPSKHMLSAFLIQSFFLLVCTGAFTATISFVTRRHSLHPLQALPTSFLSPIQSSLLTIADEDIPLEEAFRDSVSLTDGPVGVLLAAFAAVVVLAFGLKSAMGEMDNVIEKVLEDFEARLRKYYPKRWRELEETELMDVTGDARDIKLLQIMERLQQEEPEFMMQLANRAVPAEMSTTTVESEKNAPK